MRSRIIPPSQGETLTVAGDVLTFKLTSADTGDAFVLAEGIVAPGGGPPPHRHTREDELFYVLDGEVDFFIDDSHVPARAGTAIWAPRNVVHTFKNVGHAPARTLVLALPCNFERFYRECGQPYRPGTPLPAPTPEAIQKLLAIAPKYGLEVSPEHPFPNMLPPLKQEKAYWVLGELVRFHLTSPESGGNFCLCTITSQPGGGPPPHSHRDCEEIFYILEGTYEFLLGGEKHAATAGTTVFVPRGTVHNFKNVGKTRGRFVSFHTPGGFENFFFEAGTVCTDSESAPPPFDPAKVLPLCHKHGMDLV